MTHTPWQVKAYHFLGEQPSIRQWQPSMKVKGAECTPYSNLTGVPDTGGFSPDAPPHAGESFTKPQVAHAKHSDPTTAAECLVRCPPAVRVGLVFNLLPCGNPAGN
jgi:hypothetical protein